MTSPLLVVRTCIGCGAMEAPQPCTGACDDHRLDLVEADSHERVVAAAARPGAASRT